MRLLLNLIFLSASGILLLSVRDAGFCATDNPTIFYIQDSTQYSAAFLQQFHQRHNIYETVSLIGDSIIINNDRKDCMLLPTRLPLNKPVLYELKKGTTGYGLTITRINYSTVEYSMHNGDASTIMRGFADINPVFYYGSEGTFETTDGSIFGMNDYFDFRSDGKVSLLLGQENIDKASFSFVSKDGRIKMKTPLMSKK